MFHDPRRHVRGIVSHQMLIFLQKRLRSHCLHALMLRFEGEKMKSVSKVGAVKSARVVVDSIQGSEPSLSIFPILLRQDMAYCNGCWPWWSTTRHEPNIAEHFMPRLSFVQLSNLSWLFLGVTWSVSPGGQRSRSQERISEQASAKEGRGWRESWPNSVFLEKVIRSSTRGLQNCMWVSL